ncbi:DUF2637 domain-containing protein [Rhodococcus hoagii]|nr:DUF2637 domain-containing protein [Prescottella equi]
MPRRPLHRPPPRTLRALLLPHRADRPPPERSRPVTRTSSIDERLVYGIAVVAFVLSYSQLADLAVRAGYGTYMAHAWPLAVDGLAVMATRAVLRLHGGQWYARTLLGAATAVSVIAGAGAHLIPAGPLPGWAGAAVAVVPPLTLLVAPHLAVQLRRDATDSARADAAPDPTHAPADTDAPDDEPTRETAPQTDAPTVTLAAVPDLTPECDAPADQPRRTVTHAADALFGADAPADDAPAAAAESNDAKWPAALHLLVTRPDLTQRAVARKVGMTDSALRRRIGPGGRDALIAATG